MAFTAPPERVSGVIEPAKSSALTSTPRTQNTPSLYSIPSQPTNISQAPHIHRKAVSSKASADQVKAAYLRAWNVMNSTCRTGTNNNSSSKDQDKGKTKSASQAVTGSKHQTSARQSKPASISAASLPNYTSPSSSSRNASISSSATRPATRPYSKHVTKSRGDKSHKRTTKTTANAGQESTKDASQILASTSSATARQRYDALLANQLGSPLSTSRFSFFDANDSSMPASTYTWPFSLGSREYDPFDSDLYDSDGALFDSDDEDGFWRMGALSPSTSPMQSSPTPKATAAVSTLSTDSAMQHRNRSVSAAPPPPGLDLTAYLDSISEPYGTQSTVSNGYPYSLVAAYPHSSTYVSPMPTQPAVPEPPSKLNYRSHSKNGTGLHGFNDSYSVGLPTAQSWATVLDHRGQASSSKAPDATSSTSGGLHVPPTDALSKSTLNAFQSVFNDLNRDADIGGKGAMARIFEQDKEAVAEMSDLPLCSPEALQELQQRGLTTPLKAHQSSALRFLVEAEHRRVPQIPQDEEICLWRAQRFGRRTRWVNRVTQQLQPVPPELPRGAILADDMGLGKTLTILSLILSCEDGGVIVENRNKQPLPKKEAPKHAEKSKGKGKAKEHSTPDTTTNKVIEIEESIPTTTSTNTSCTKDVKPAIAEVSANSKPTPKSLTGPTKREHSPDVILVEPPCSKKIKTEVIDLCDDEDDKKLWATFDDDSDIAEIDVDQIVASQPSCKAEQPIVINDDDDDLWDQVKMDDDDFEILDNVVSSQMQSSQGTSSATSVPFECAPSAVKTEIKSEPRPIAPLGSVSSLRKPSIDGKVANPERPNVSASAPVKTRSPSPVLAATASSSLPASSRSSPIAEEAKPTRSRPSKPTLIVCPLSVLSNWTGQADAHISSPPMKYAVMHGKETQILRGVADWGQYDFVLTTYDLLKASRRRLALLAQHRLRVSRTDANIENLEATLDRAESSLKSAHAWQRAQAQASVDTLKDALADAKDRRNKQVICPPKKGGDSDYRKMAACEARALRVRARKANDEEFSDDELYEIWTGNTQPPSGERLFHQEWLRVILDEAHVIRNASTQTFEAVRALQTERRVAVTGTPIVNSTKDLGSLAAWIGIQPFDDETAGPRLWNEHVEKGLPGQDASSVRILRAITKALVILRTKEMEVNGKPLVDLPEIKSFKYEIEMHADDKRLYRDAESKLREKLIEWAEAGELHRKNANILVILGRLRQLANDRRLVPHNVLELIARDMGEVGTDADGRTSAAAPKVLTAPQIQTLRDVLQAKIEDGECCKVCNQSLGYTCDGVDPPVIASCGHAFHQDCITQRMQTDKTCPLDARQLGAVSNLVSLPIAALDDTAPAGDGSGRDSNKIESVAKIVHTVYASAPHDKTIIFSNFVGLLRLIGARLERDGVPFVTLYGCHSKNQREITLASFNRQLGVPDRVEDAASAALKIKKLGTVIPRVILMSIGAGSVGLNLTVANHVVLVDPWWNEAIQLQAINRAHRIGQTKEVNVHRLVSKDTVEERVVQIANEKIELATFALSGVKHNGKSVFNGNSKSTMRNIGALVGMTQQQRTRFAAAARNN